jgi:hypothetical protein
MDTNDYRKKRDNKYQLDSKDRLSKILKKKVQTTMIGALSTMEKYFGFLWNSDTGKLTEDQKKMLELYQAMRSEILDKGNHQARNIDAELSQYNVEWLRYNMTIPVINKE